MHRQAMLVSLSLSPASTAAKNDKHWAFLEEIDAPQWADLKAEEALAKAGTIGDDPWFYRSHSHHEVPLTKITGDHAADVKDSKASVRTPNLERKKNRRSSKAKLTFDGATVAKSKETHAKEDRRDESSRAGYNAGCHDNRFGADSPRDRIASPVHCKSPETFLSARRFVSSATSDDYAAGNDHGTGVLGSSNFRTMDTFENLFVQTEQLTTEPETMPVSSTSSAGQSAGGSDDEDMKPSQSSLPWQDTVLPNLKDTSRLRKSLGSALRVKVDGSADNPPNTKQQAAATRPKSRLRQSVQLEAAALPVTSGSERATTFLKKDTASCGNEDGALNPDCLSRRIRSGDGANAGTELANKLGINSSVQAFDDIRKLRKSWGSALRVKVNDDTPAQGLSSKHDVSDVPPTVSDEKGDCSSVKRDEMGVDLPSILDIQSTRAGSEEKKLPGVDLPEAVRAFERKSQNPTDRREALNSVKELEVASPKSVAAGAAKKFRRSVSFDHAPGRGPDNIKTSTSNRSHLVQPKQASRASSVSRLNGPLEKTDKVRRVSKGGKENTNLNSLAKTTKLNPELSTGTPRMTRQTVTRMSMPSLTFAAHARAAMGANGGTVLKPSGNSVVETNPSDSRSYAAAPASKKSAGGLDTGSRTKTEATVTNPAAKMITRQSILRSSMPVFSAAAAAKQGSKATLETGAALKPGAKNSSKIGNGDADLAALLAEHNRKFRPKSTYEPRIHSVKDIREWEARTGQLFYNLLPSERERANQEISAAKQTTQRQK